MYGIKIFEVSFLQKHRSRTAIDINALQQRLGVPLKEHLTDCLNRLAAGDNLTGTPNLNDLETIKISDYQVHGSKDDPRICFAEPDSGSNAQHIVYGSFEYGKIGSHGTALAATSANNTNIEASAPSNGLRFKLFLPQQGNKALLAMETRGRTCPSSIFRRFLILASKETASTDSGIGISLKEARDSKSFEELLRNAEEVSLKLTKYCIDNRSNRKRTQQVLQQNLASDSAINNLIKKVAKQWITREGTDTSCGVTLVQSCIDGKFDQDFDEGSVHVRSKGLSTKITPDDLGDYFTYRLWEQRPTDAVWATQAEDIVRDIAHELQIELP